MAKVLLQEHRTAAPYPTHLNSISHDEKIPEKSIVCTLVKVVGLDLCLHSYDRRCLRHQSEELAHGAAKA
jgi:hypothetical protein